MKDYPFPAITDYLHAELPPTCLPNYPIYVIYLMFAMLYFALFTYSSNYDPVYSCVTLYLSSSFDICVCVPHWAPVVWAIVSDCLLLALAAATRVPDMAMEWWHNDDIIHQHINYTAQTTVQPMCNTCFGRRMLKEGWPGNCHASGGDRVLGFPHFMQMRKTLQRLGACEAQRSFSRVGGRRTLVPVEGHDKRYPGQSRYSMTQLCGHSASDQKNQKR